MEFQEDLSLIELYSLR